MKISEVKELVEKSAMFKEWKAVHKNAILMSLLTMFDEQPSDQWIVSYFDDSQITTFFFDGKECQKKQEEPAQAKVNEVDVSKAKLELEDAVKSARLLLAGTPTKTIAILQTLEKGQVWNISFMTAGFKVFNAKLDSETGQVLSKDYGDMFARL